VQNHQTIKRSCGISYVKKTESEQLGVRDRGYDKLPPLVIQGSYTLPKTDLHQWIDEAATLVQVNNALDRIFFKAEGEGYLVVTFFESPSVVEMKNYLLKPHKRL
jgi:hypothetical protein